MKKTLLVALALVLACTCAMAQGKKNVKGAPQSITISSNSKVAPNDEGVIKTFDLPPAEVGLDFPMRVALEKRRSVRDYNEEEVPEELISSLLWTAYGFNRPDEEKRVVPSAVNVQEFDIYLFTPKGIFRYMAEKNLLELITEGDHRANISEQKHFAIAPVSIVIVANYDRMKVFKDVETRDFYAAVDAGYVSQNIYLFCSGNGLGTVACGGINRDFLNDVLKITNGKAMLAHPVGMIR